MPPLSTPIREVDEVAEALRLASSELGRREAALRASEEHLRLIVESATDTSIITTDAEGTISSWSPGAAAIFGWSAAEAVGRPAALIFTPEDRERGEPGRELEMARREGCAADERWHLRKDGGRVFMVGSARPMHDGQGRQIGFLKVARDETERRRIAEALAVSERRLRAVFEAVPVGIVIAEAPSGRILEGNARTEAILRQPVVPSPNIDDYWRWAARHPDGRPVDPKDYPLSRVIRGEEERPESEFIYERGDGTEAWVRIIGAPIRDEAGAIAGGVVAILDIDRQKRAEEALRGLNATLEERVAERTRERDRIWRVSQDLLGVADATGRWVSINPAWEAALGWSEADILGRTSEWLEHPDDKEAVRAEIARLAAGQKTLAFENRFRRRDGGYIWLSWTAVPEEGLLYCVARDVTAVREAAAALARAEEQLRQAQKMEAVGRLTGGVAHDFNNMLQVMVGRLDRMRRLADKGGPPSERDLQSMEYALERATTLTHRLLAFSRQQPLELREVEVNKLVAGMSDLLRQTLGETVRIETVLAGELWKAMVDPNQLENAILNLAVNARDAMPEGGTLTIETANTDLDEASAEAQGGGMPPGQYVLLAVSDTGTGMPAEVVEKAFEPFFTTKPQGQGTGLGLSMIYGFVKQSGGHVRIHSEPGRGTTLRLYLPRHGDEGAAASPLPNGTPRAEVPSGRGEAVLVVEDEEEVRRLKAETLRELGYAVVEAGEAQEGLRLLETRPDIVLLLTDIGLPGVMNGRALSQEATARRPGLKTLYTSGYAPNASLHRDGAEADAKLLTKPFTQEALAVKVRHLLDAGPPVPAPAGAGRAPAGDGTAPP